jgi:hypothetical protein
MFGFTKVLASNCMSDSSVIYSLFSNLGDGSMLQFLFSTRKDLEFKSTSEQVKGLVPIPGRYHKSNSYLISQKS